MKRVFLKTVAVALAALAVGNAFAADITGAGTRKAAAELAAKGFAVAMVNYRGTHESEGTWVGYRALAWGEKKDGYDICEWLAAQPWSTGKVGSFGSSQGGFAQNFLAVTQPPHLVAQYMVDTGLSLYQEGYRIGGVTRPSRFKVIVDSKGSADNEALLREWDQHTSYDDYWRAEDCSLHFGEMNVPCFTIGSWYDFMCQGSVASFRLARAPSLISWRISAPTTRKKMVISPSFTRKCRERDTL